MSSWEKAPTHSPNDSGATAGLTTNLLTPASTNAAIRSRAPAQPSATSAVGSASARRRRTAAANASGMSPNAITTLIP